MAGESTGASQWLHVAMAGYQCPG